jgi:alkanesulfonate monooxygenase SsuD/methylene tetrahydromethanopterin reductase-like flavin-dependent oxidoreductase (luciferase family)
MQFSVFIEIQIADPTRANEAQAYRDCVAQAVLADQLGYRAVWAVEHHGLYEYSHSSAPEVFLAFVAAQTQRIRLGHGVTLLPHRYNHPIRIAERVAALDVLSGGRVEWGTGKSSSLTEQMAFESDISTLHDQWLEALTMIPRMWSEDVFAHKGRFFDIPPTQIVPKPIQTPHPPIHMACSNPESTLLAGRLGIGALHFAFGTDAELAERVAGYRGAIRDAERAEHARGENGENKSPGGRRITNRFACAPAALVLNDDRKAARHGLRGSRFFAQSMAQYFFTGERPLGRLRVARDFLREERLDERMALRNAAGSEPTTIVGDPACACETIDRFVRIGVDELLLVFQMGTVPHELVMESMRTFAEKVMPKYG